MNEKANLLVSIGNPQLLPILLQALSVISRAKPKQHFVIFSDQPSKKMDKVKNIEWVYLDKEIYQNKNSSFSVVEVNKLINRLESQAFDSIYCLESTGWGRWIVDCIEKITPIVLRDYGPDRRPMTYSKILEVFEVTEDPMSSQRVVCHDLNELYVNTQAGVKCLLVTDKGGEGVEDSLFSTFHDILIVPQGTICTSKTKKLVNLWVGGQLLSTYAPINEWTFSFHYVVCKRAGWFLNSMDQTFIEFDQIKKLIAHYSLRDSKIPKDIGENIQGLRRSMQILLIMINNMKSGLHLFSGIQTQYFSYLIAEQIFSGVCPSRITFFDQKAVLLELEKFKKYIDHCQEIISRNAVRSFR